MIQLFFWKAALSESDDYICKNHLIKKFLLTYKLKHNLSYACFLGQFEHAILALWAKKLTSKIFLIFVDISG